MATPEDFVVSSVEGACSNSWSTRAYSFERIDPGNTTLDLLLQDRNGSEDRNAYADNVGTNAAPSKFDELEL